MSGEARRAEGASGTGDQAPALRGIHIVFHRPQSEFWSAQFHGESDDSWLGFEEAREGARWRHVGRRRDWRRGRYLAKWALREVIQLELVHLADLEILSRDAETGLGTSPRIRYRGNPLPFSLSVAHVDGAVAVAVAKTTGARVGIDLVRRQEAGKQFQASWFTEREQRSWNLQDGDEPLAFWAAKEALFKALGRRRFEPRQFELQRLSQGRFQCPACLDENSEGVDLRTWRDGDYLLALAVVGGSL